ncbi:MAG: hypothetical protein LBR26_13765 [Prevotella sp.]|nr:hypothetical protein [Prevotella sp.]
MSHFKEFLTQRAQRYHKGHREKTLCVPCVFFAPFAIPCTAWFCAWIYGKKQCPPVLFNVFYRYEGSLELEEDTGTGAVSNGIPASIPAGDTDQGFRYDAGGQKHVILCNAERISGYRIAASIVFE